ncbi:hypothetical protein [Herbaspirillum huttiense]|uniref:hypothetical protein n=1 Tax=Herbaspirillum huttiense TaxID=863372 RepID=UPI0039B05D19
MEHRGDLSRMMRMADLPKGSSHAQAAGFFGRMATAAGQSATISFISIPACPHASSLPPVAPCPSLPVQSVHLIAAGQHHFSFSSAIWQMQ